MIRETHLDGEASLGAPETKDGVLVDCDPLEGFKGDMGKRRTGDPGLVIWSVMTDSDIL